VGDSSDAGAHTGKIIFELFELFELFDDILYNAL